MFTLLSFLIAVLALSFLIFIHELGHYFMARRVGMRVETFSIGIGRAIYSWQRAGTKWQIGWLPFGGFVKIAGTDTDKNQDCYAIKDGFFGKSPWDRIKVALMGPLVNILFALMAFALLWVNGGRDKNFSEYTKKVGWVDTQSELYQRGVRPGDEIVSYDGHPFEGFKDHLYAPLTASGLMSVKGYKVNNYTLEKTPFEYKIKPYSNPNYFDSSLMTSGILNSASYVIYNKLPNGKDNPLPEGSPLNGSGIQYGDRLVWVDGHLVFSVPQLTDVINDNRVLVTVQRGDSTLLVRVPRVQVKEFRLDPEFKEELIDWQYEANLKGVKYQDLYSLPYVLTNDGVVEGQVKFLDKDEQEKVFPPAPVSSLEAPLLARDKIIAIDGSPIKQSHQILSKIQDKQVLIIVERMPASKGIESWKNEDAQFDKEMEPAQLEKIVRSIGTDKLVTAAGPYVLLKPVNPKPRSQIVLSKDNQVLQKTEWLEQKKEAEAIEDPEKRARILSLINQKEKEYVIGMPMIQDRKVEYNPIPTDMFGSVFSEIWRTLGALFNGNLNPKWLSGPVGIIQVVQSQGMLGMNELLFWIGAISLNLGVLNLLPIPMLDGGTIVFSLFEGITGKKIKPKTMEKVILPFAVLLILFFVFVTFNDISRIFGGFLKW